jgi:uncharacterized membrane protein YesL
MKHVIMMLIGCVLPFLLIFILPALGVSNDLMLVIFIVLCSCHLFAQARQSRKEPHEHQQTP